MNGSSSGTSGKNVATVTFKGRIESDQIADVAFREMVRRFEITFEGRETSDIWSETTAPDDKTLIWWPKDPTSGTRIGQPQTYDTATGKWIPLGTGNKLPEKRQRRSGEQFIGAGVSQSVTISFEKFGSDTYDLTVTPKVAAAPANLNSFAWAVTAQDDGSFTLQIYNVPAAGMNLRWHVSEINDDKY